MCGSTIGSLRRASKWGGRLLRQMRLRSFVTSRRLGAHRNTSSRPNSGRERMDVAPQRAQTAQPIRSSTAGGPLRGARLLRLLGSTMFENQRENSEMGLPLILLPGRAPQSCNPTFRSLVVVERQKRPSGGCRARKQPEWREAMVSIIRTCKNNQRRAIRYDRRRLPKLPQRQGAAFCTVCIPAQQGGVGLPAQHRRPQGDPPTRSAIRMP
jgi:hypothetical protein